MKLLLKLILISASLTSCTVNHFVQLKSDGSAIVETDYDETLKDEIIESNIAHYLATDTISFRMTYKIQIIDSIGLYLPGQNSGFLTFKDFGDSIVIVFFAGLNQKGDC